MGQKHHAAQAAGGGAHAFEPVGLQSFAAAPALNQPAHPVGQIVAVAVGFGHLIIINGVEMQPHAALRPHGCLQLALQVEQRLPGHDGHLVKRAVAGLHLLAQNLQLTVQLDLFTELHGLRALALRGNGQIHLPCGHVKLHAHAGMHFAQVHEQFAQHVAVAAVQPVFLRQIGVAGMHDRHREQLHAPLAQAVHKALALRPHIIAGGLAGGGVQLGGHGQTGCLKGLRDFLQVIVRRLVFISQNRHAAQHVQLLLRGEGSALVQIDITGFHVGISILCPRCCLHYSMKLRHMYTLQHLLP